VIVARAAIVGALLVGPTTLAFISGGYFDRPRLWAGIAAWVAVAVAAVVCATPWPRTRAAWLAIGGLGALSAWTIVSIEWAPLRDAAQADAQRTLLYLGAVLAGTAALRARGAARAVEPALAFGALLVIVEGLSERLFPGVFHLSRDAIAAGRLNQPLTYWNAMGILAAMGVVLFVRVAGDGSRPRQLRVAAVAAGPPVALGLYLTLSRGALLAMAIGLVILILLVPTREQAGTAVLMLIGAIPAVVTAGTLSGVRTLQGTLGSRESAGLAVAFVLAASMLASAIAMARHLRPRGTAIPANGSDPTVRRLAVACGLALAVTTVVLFIAAATSRVALNQVDQVPTATSARLVSTDSIRGNFWSVAIAGFREHPIRGLGAGGFETEWRRRRTIIYSARDAHSLYLETLSELGIVGALTLVALLSGVALCARRAYLLDPGLSAGWIAVVSMWAVHSGLDWDWEMPAVTLFAFVLVGAILAQADRGSALAEAPATVTPATELPIAASVES
jgi:hypothetical protein